MTLVLIIVQSCNSKKIDRKVLIELDALQLGYSVNNFKLNKILYSDNNKKTDLTVKFIFKDTIKSNDLFKDDRIIKLKFENDSVISIKTYKVENNNFRIKGNMGNYNSKLIENPEKLKSFMSKIYLKSWYDS